MPKRTKKDKFAYPTKESVIQLFRRIVSEACSFYELQFKIRFNEGIYGSLTFEISPPALYSLLGWKIMEKIMNLIDNAYYRCHLIQYMMEHKQPIILGGLLLYPKCGCSQAPLKLVDRRWMYSCDYEEIIHDYKMIPLPEALEKIVMEYLEGVGIVVFDHSTQSKTRRNVKCECEQFSGIKEYDGQFLY